MQRTSEAAFVEATTGQISSPKVLLRDQHQLNPTIGLCQMFLCVSEVIVHDEGSYLWVPFFLVWLILDHLVWENRGTP